MIQHWLQKKYSINFSVTRKKFWLNLHYNGANSALFVNGVEISKIKAKDSEIVALCSKFSIMSRKRFKRLFCRKYEKDWIPWIRL